MMTEPEKIDYREGISRVAAEVRLALGGAPGPVGEVAEFLASTCGKGVRTALLMASAMDAEGRVPPSAVGAAQAVELLHMATLVHDDIIDDAPLRRGRPSVQSRFGKDVAVLGGDWLLTLAVRRALEVDYPAPEGDEKKKLAYRIFDSAEDVLLGELMQRRHNRNLDLSVLQYLRIINKKTAALFYLASVVGTELGGCPEREKTGIVRFSRYLGVVFQIVDDLKDYTMDEGEILKTSRHDLVSGVVTMPLILSLAREPGLRKLARLVLLGERDAAALIADVNDAGGIENARRFAGKCADKARGLIEGVSPEKREALNTLLDLSLASAGAF